MVLFSTSGILACHSSKLILILHELLSSLRDDARISRLNLAQLRMGIGKDEGKVVSDVRPLSKISTSHE
jgi:hypothetical protein